jgi:hypothetical protein
MSYIATFLASILTVLPRAWRRGGAWNPEDRFLRKIADEVDVVDDDLSELFVHSVRPKPDWNEWTTIRYQDRFYYIADCAHSRGLRPFSWHLRLCPPGRPITTIRTYLPTDVLGDPVVAVPREP